MANVIALSVLVLVFVISTVRSVNMGALALVAAFVVGTLVFTVDTSEILDGFPASLFVILVGVTYLFALARNNGTVDWIIHAAVRAVRGRVALVPWAMFAVCAAVTAMGAVSPAAVAIIAPVANGLRHPLPDPPHADGLHGRPGRNGGQLLPYRNLRCDHQRRHASERPPVEPGLAVRLDLRSRGRCCRNRVRLVRRSRIDCTRRLGARARQRSRQRVWRWRHHHRFGFRRQLEGWRQVLGWDRSARGSTQPERRLTLLGLASLALGALVFDLDVGFTALTVAVLLTLIFPASARGAVDKISWGTVLLIGGIVTYVALLQNQNTVQWLGDSVAHVGVPLLAAFLICLIGAIVSAFASTTGILGALIPLAIPFLMTGQVNATGLVIALAISSSLVDCSPFSTNGALVVANAAPEERDVVFGLTMRWGMTIMVVTPILAWLLFVVPWSV